MSKKNQHVVPHQSGWAVKGAGNSRASSVHGTQREAIAAARESAMRQGSEMLIHGENGRIRERNGSGQNVVVKRPALRLLAFGQVQQPE